MRRSAWLLLAAALLLALSAPVAVRADTPANCTYDDFLGTWTMWLSDVLPTPTKPSLDCDFEWTPATDQVLKFSYPNVVTADGRFGNWTLIYNQGAEMWVNNAIIFGFSGYDMKTGAFDCRRTQVGWFHKADGSEWRCMLMRKHNRIVLDEEVSTAAAAKPTFAQAKQASLQVDGQRAAKAAAEEERLSRKFTTDHAFLAKVNKAAKGQFTVKEYPEYNGQTIGDLERVSGVPAGADGAASYPADMQAPSPFIAEAEKQHLLKYGLDTGVGAIPDNFDWRNVSGVNYVSPVRSQRSCGSCYAFASAHMMESRIRVRSNNKLQPILSPQDVVSCSVYSQGCQGGFNYLIGGKYGRDYGFAEEACYPYLGVDQKTCSPNPQKDCNPQRWMTKEYYYIGGFYGQATPELMQKDILANGPIAVSFQVYDDLRHYAGGVYSHKFASELLLDDYNPFQLVSHAVVCVGWGVTPANEGSIPYWIIKNSWGESWGEQGYFRIARSLKTHPTGGDCAVESIPFSAIPILP